MFPHQAADHLTRPGTQARDHRNPPRSPGRRSEETRPGTQAADRRTVGSLPGAAQETTPEGYQATETHSPETDPETESAQEIKRPGAESTQGPEPAPGTESTQGQPARPAGTKPPGNAGTLPEPIKAPGAARAAGNRSEPQQDKQPSRTRRPRKPQQDPRTTSSRGIFLLYGSNAAGRDQTPGKRSEPAGSLPGPGTLARIPGPEADQTHGRQIIPAADQKPRKAPGPGT